MLRLSGVYEAYGTHEASKGQLPELSELPELSDHSPQFGTLSTLPLGAGHRSVEYDPCPSAAGQARAEVRRQLECWGLTEHSETVELLVSELVTNALVHARSRLRLTLTAAHGVLRCEVSDADHRRPRVRRVKETAESGRGMFLVDALARRWGSHQDGQGKTVWFELDTCGLDGCGGRRP
ncbi:ATP-binding protein [Streptomyces spongiae]|uniref:ATP-binding protein n=1 Tax=Streptomyces spongiae TaxID=565072 RepID=A0A5N8XUN1_9ACTN|nr:ATP-binding protein [Streptomyces spongiae]MPY63103.1 ATP-binding protein [Streptomyces spongiae]